jgi:hypothetical protein
MIRRFGLPRLVEVALHRRRLAMTATTFAAVKGLLLADPPITLDEQIRLRALMPSPAAPAKETSSVARIVRRAEAAKRLSCSLRLIDKLSASGELPRRTLPGRRRAAGVLESDVIALVNGKEIA